MKHLAQIQNEFLKEAGKWDEYSYEYQKKYIQEHPNTTKRITKKPVQKKKKKLTANELKGLKEFLKKKFPRKNIDAMDEGQLMELASKLKNSQGRMPSAYYDYRRKYKDYGHPWGTTKVKQKLKTRKEELEDEENDEFTNDNKKKLRR